MWFKGREYLNKMGSVILIASILIWALGYFPTNISYSKNYSSEIAKVEQNTHLSLAEKTKLTEVLELDRIAEKQEKSYIGQLGHAIEPIIEPLGFDWKMGVSILTGLAAKEVVVSTMGVLYHSQGNTANDTETLKNRIKEQKHSSGALKGRDVFSPLASISFMLFVLIYFPCVAVIAAIRKEANWRWAVFTMVYTTGLAWLLAFAVYQIGSLFV